MMSFSSLKLPMRLPRSPIFVPGSTSPRVAAEPPSPLMSVVKR